jgi:hypothetical protein
VTLKGNSSGLRFPLGSTSVWTHESITLPTKWIFTNQHICHFATVQYSRPDELEIFSGPDYVIVTTAISIPRIHNPSEMAAETRNLPWFWVIYPSHLTPSPTYVANALPGAGAEDIRHAALFSLPQALQLRPTG